MNDRSAILIPAGVYFMATSACASFGRYYGIRWLYDWGDGIGMAYSTALNFFLLGVVLYVLGRIERNKPHE